MTSSTITIDGSQGEGGGQILRSSLALALVTGKPLVINHIRAGRQKPGLQRQHLAAVLAAAKVGQAEVEGAHLGSQRLDCRPGKVRPGEYRFRIGTAGSTTLVAQTVLPALLLAEGESHITIEGGTHNPMAPPADFIEKAYLPLVNRLGPSVSAELVRPGFYPAGGGEFIIDIKPAHQLRRLMILERGQLRAQRVRVLLSRLPRHIAERECHVIAAKSGWPETSFTVDEVRNPLSSGNAVIIELEFEHVSECFAAIGQLGVSAENVARSVWRETKNYLASGVPIGPHLADQIMLPLGIAAHFGTGGQFRTTDLTPHSETHIDILRRFLDVDISIDRQGNDNTVVRIEPAAKAIYVVP